MAGEAVIWKAKQETSLPRCAEKLRLRVVTVSSWGGGGGAWGCWSGGVWKSTGVCECGVCKSVS